jgi:NAD(P)-dependent dehydrogenase (short-subunit alcohol dehydrogenase family)
MSARLEGKVCIITGTGGRMGRASALAFAREGASIVGCDLDVDAAQATVELVRGAAGEMASMHPCHLTDPADCQALIELAIGTFGRVDVLFNLAATTAYFNWLEDVTDEEWDRARRNEVDLVFYLSRAAWSHLKASGGVVVNTASVNGSLSTRGRPLPRTRDEQGGHHRDDATTGAGGARARDPGQLDLTGPDRDQRIARPAEGP